MNQNNTMTFYDGNDLKVLPLNIAKNSIAIDFPETFFLKKSGMYKKENNMWEIKEEGLYEFIEYNGARKRYYYFKKDINKLISIISPLCKFSGVYKPLEDADAFKDLDEKLITEDEECLYPVLFIIFILLGLRVAHRHVGIFSPVAENTVLNWLEIWDEKQKNWSLYWVEKNLWIGYTNKENNCFDIYDNMLEDETGIFSCKLQELNTDFSSIKELFSNKNENISTDTCVKYFLEKTKAFPVVRNDGHYVLRAQSSLRYKEHINDEIDQIRLSGIDYLNYKIEFVDNDFIDNNIYGKQIYVFSGRYVCIVN